MLVREKVDAETIHVVAKTMTPPNHPDVFAHRHIGPDAAEARTMLEVIGHESMEEFIDAVVPANIRQRSPLNLPQALAEVEALARLRKIAEQNQPTRSFLGMGYHDCIVPAVIQRNLLENPGWYTQYTPYQSEIDRKSVV